MDPLAQLKLRFDLCVSVENLFPTLPLPQPSNLEGFKIKIWSVLKLEFGLHSRLKFGLYLSLEFSLYSRLKFGLYSRLEFSLYSRLKFDLYSRLVCIQD